MPLTYRAILKKDHLEWLGDGPPAAESVQVLVMVMGEAELGAGKSDGKAMADALREISDRGGLAGAGIPNPVEWQREMRRDRPLPGRNG